MSEAETLTDEKTAPSAAAERPASVGYTPTPKEIEEREQPEMATLLDQMRQGRTLGYEDDDRPNASPWLAGGLALGAFVIVGLFILASRSVLHYADGMKSSLSHGASREVNYTERDSGASKTTGAGGGLTRFNSPGLPNGLFRPAQGLSRSAPPPAVAPAPAQNLLTGPFLGQADRAAAHASLNPLHELVQIFQRYDSILKGSANSGGTVSISGSTNSSGIAPVTFSPPGAGSPGGAGGTQGALFLPNGGGGGNTPRVDQAVVDRVEMQTNALEAQSTLVTHSDLFAPPLQPAVREFHKEMAGYLTDVRLAVTADSDTRTTLHSAASRRFSRAQSLLGYMDGVVNGSIDPDRKPMP